MQQIVFCGIWRNPFAQSSWNWSSFCTYADYFPYDKLCEVLGWSFWYLGCTCWSLRSGWPHYLHASIKQSEYPAQLCRIRWRTSCVGAVWASIWAQLSWCHLDLPAESNQGDSFSLHSNIVFVHSDYRVVDLVNINFAPVCACNDNLWMWGHKAIAWLSHDPIIPG